MDCPLCDINEECDDEHSQSALHRFNYALHDFNQSKTHLAGNRHGIQIDVEVIPLNGFKYDMAYNRNKRNYYLQMNPERFEKHNYQLKFSCKIKNVRTKHDDPLILVYYDVLYPSENFTMYDPNENPGFKKELLPGAAYTTEVHLNLDASHVSNYKIPVYFTFQTKSTEKEKMKSFSISRCIIVAIHDELIMHQEILEASPFTHQKWEKCTVIPPRKNFRMPDTWPIPPKYYWTLFWGLKKDFGTGILQEIQRKLEPGYVTPENYAEFFHILLWLEEMCVAVGLSCYNMENVKLRYKAGDVLELFVPGLAEKRPSVVKGDLIEIKAHGDHTSYQGIIQRLADRSVDIFFLDHDIIDQIKRNPDLEMDVRFILGRIHFERMHAGVEQVVENQYVNSLFPDKALAAKPAKLAYNLTEAELFNKQIYNNNEQRTAVINILNNTSKGAPYIVYGPPGTGKTVTLVEAIYQIKRLTNYKIMVCAPSNAACNMLTERLAEFCKTNEMRRVMSENSDLASVHENIAPFCNIVIDEDGNKEVVPFRDSELKKYKIIVSTLVRAGKYNRIHHPDVVFIDEAAQAREPEACCAIALLKKGKQLILAGDPKQLGPVIHSDLCKEYKYDVSILERMMEFPIYQNNTNYLSMLKLNFRSHPDILSFSNKFFYDNHLKPVSRQALNDPLSKMSIYEYIVHEKKVGIYGGSAVEFCAVLAKEQREGRSPSYFNEREILLVLKFVQALVSLKFDKSEHRVNPDEIGVVTPYIRQVYKIRDTLARHGFDQIDVGTTEAFQGREKRVIIMSTVRAQEDLLLVDKKYKLGFVKDDKRFNVAVTRAKSKLILIGNPNVLSTDKKFREVIRYTRSENTCCGAPFKDRTSKVRDDIVSKMQNLKLRDSKPPSN